MKNVLATGEAGAMDSVIQTIVGLDKVFSEAQLSAQRDLNQTTGAANRVASVSQFTKKPSEAEITAARSAAGVNLDGSPRVVGAGEQPPAGPVSLDHVPPGLVNSVFPSLPSTAPLSRESLLRAYLANGKLNKDVLDAVDRLFPPVDPKAVSLKYNLQPFISGFTMFNQTIVAHATQASIWVKAELIDPSTGRIPPSLGVTDEALLEPALLCYVHPELFGALVGHLIQQNHALNGLPQASVTGYQIAVAVVSALNRLLSALTKGRVTSQRSRGAKAVWRLSAQDPDDHRPWL
jgi:hypothetical protein